MSQTIPFLRLPSELRIIIYHMVAKRKLIIHVELKQTKAYKDPERRERLVSASRLIATCRQVYAEYCT